MRKPNRKRPDLIVGFEPPDVTIEPNGSIRLGPARRRDEKDLMLAQALAGLGPVPAHLARRHLSEAENELAAVERGRREGTSKSIASRRRKASDRLRAVEAIKAQGNLSDSAAARSYLAKNDPEWSALPDDDRDRKIRNLAQAVSNTRRRKIRRRSKKP